MIRPLFALATEEEQIQRRQWRKELAIQTRETHDSPRSSAAAREPRDCKETSTSTIARPVRVDPNVPGPGVPKRASAETREKLRRLALEMKESGTLELEP